MYTLQTKFCQSAEPRWRDARCYFGQRPPAALHAWLSDSGSLTARLRAKSGGDFSVRVLNQAWARPHLSERRLLGMADAHWGLIREVLLCGGGQPWVFARSVMPVTSLSGDLSRLRQLDNQPLGQLLFNYPGMSRSGYQFCHMPAALLSPSVVGEYSAGLWGRRSRFVLRGRPLLVSEIFLPAFQP